MYESSNDGHSRKCDAPLLLCLVSWTAAGNARHGVRRARDMSQKIPPHDAYYYLSKPNNVATQPAE